MKLRLRIQKSTTVLALGDDDKDIKIKDLKDRIAVKLSLEHGTSFDLSLNGRDQLSYSDDDSIQHLGLVSGDMLYLMLPESPDTRQPSASKPTQSRPTLLSQQNAEMTKKVSQSQNHSQNDADTQEFSDAPVGQSAINYGDDSAQYADVEDPENEDTVPDPLVNRYLNEPMLCRESSDESVPHILESLHESASVQCPADAVVVVLHALMLEVGFTCKQKTTQDANTSEASLSTAMTSLPPGWRLGHGAYRMNYSHAQYPEIECSLMCVLMGKDTLVVHSLIPGENSWDKILNVKCSEFVQDFTLGPSQTYRNIPKLSRLFKDTIACPLLAHVKEALNIEDHEGFLGMMYEIKLRILRYLDVASLLRLSEVSKDVNTVCSDNWLWRRLHLKDFGRRDNQSLQQDWKTLYKDLYLRKKEARRRRQHFMSSLVHPFAERPHPPHPFTPIYPPGAIGGDYDLHPQFPGLPGHPGNPLLLPRPRFDPFNPLPDANLSFMPGRGRGPRDNRHHPFGRGGFGWRF